jgi:hypothetical protein
MFGAEYVNRLQSMVARHLHIPHEFVCVTDDATGLNPSVRPVHALWDDRQASSAHCWQRLRMYDARSAAYFGPRYLTLDLDVIIVDDITPLVMRPEPLVCWRVGYAGVYAGGIVLQDAGVLDGLWRMYAADPEGTAKRTVIHAASDQDILNWYLRHNYGKPVAAWTEADGLMSCYGEARHFFRARGPVPPRPTVKPAGMPNAEWHALRRRTPEAPLRTFNPGEVMPELPTGTRIVFVGHRDKVVMDSELHPWVKEHWR